MASRAATRHTVSLRLLEANSSRAAAIAPSENSEYAPRAFSTMSLSEPSLRSVAGEACATAERTGSDWRGCGTGMSILGAASLICAGPVWMRLAGTPCSRWKASLAVTGRPPTSPTGVLNAARMSSARDACCSAVGAGAMPAHCSTCDGSLKIPCCGTARLVRFRPAAGAVEACGVVSRFRRSIGSAGLRAGGTTPTTPPIKPPNTKPAAACLPTS